MEPVVVLKNFSCRYRKKKDPVISDLSLEIQPNSIVQLSGINGSGKSTLLHVLADIIPTNLDFTADQISITGSTCIVFQDPSLQLLTFSVKEEIAMKLGFKRVKRTTRQKHVNEILSEFGIEKLKDKDPHQISSGEQQLVVILSNIIEQSSIILLDEPFTYLDQHNIEILIEYLLELKSQGYTIIIASHLSLGDDLIDQYVELPNSIKFEDDLPKLSWKPDTGSSNYKIDGKIGYKDPIAQIAYDFAAHGIYMVKGPNGSGKTCLLLSLAKMIEMGDGDLEMPEDSIFIPQRVSYFFTEATVRQELGALEIPAKLQPYLDYSPFQLSVGLQKLLAIYIGLSNFTVCLIDEPFQSLDQAAIKFILDLLIEFKWSKLIVFSSNRDLSRLGLEIPIITLGVN